MSFINFNKREDHSAEYSVEMIKEALLAVESKNINKVNSLVEGLAGNIKLNEALNLFSNKIDGMSALDVAKLNNMDQIIEAKANLVEIKVGGKKIKVDINTIEIDGIDTRDYPDFVDAFFSYAEDYRGRELTDDELDVLTDEHADLINELIFDQQLYAGLIIAEGKSINKIQKEWAEVTADMASTVKTWKTAEGETKTQLLDKLKALNIRKKELDGELEIAVMGKDRNVELSGAFEAFSRMSSDVVGNELYDAAQKLSDYYDWLKAGNDSGKGETLDEVISLLKKCKKSIKRFDKPEEVKGTAFESFVTEKIKVKDIENTWNSMYGEDFKDEYAGVYDEIIRKYKGKVTKDELAKLWDKMYGEVMQDEYSGFFDSLDESVVTEAKFVKEFDEAVLKATTQEEVLEIYPNAEFFIGKSDHFFGELDDNLFFKAYYTKAQKEFEIKSIYSEKNSNYVHLYNESVVTENRELMKIDSYLNTKDESVLIDFLDDAYGNSDNRETRREWNDARNDLSYNELVDYAVAHAENFGMDLQDIEDAIEVYESLNEGRSVNKIQKEWNQVTTDMIQKVAAWKAAEGDRKAEILEELKALTAKKKALESELDVAVAGKDRDVQLVVSEGNAFGAARAEAIAKGEKTFKVDGEEHDVESVDKEDKENAEEFVSERNAFLAARAKAIQEESDEFEFNGKTYPVVYEGNAFGAARAEAIANGASTFTVDGEEYDVEDVDAEDKKNAEEFVEESEILWDALIEKFAVTNEDLRSDIKKYIKTNKKEIDALADQDDWDRIYSMLMTDFEVEEDDNKAADELKTIFNIVY